MSTQSVTDTVPTIQPSRAQGFGAGFGVGGAVRRASQTLAHRISQVLESPSRKEEAPPSAQPEPPRDVADDGAAARPPKADGGERGDGDSGNNGSKQTGATGGEPAAKAAALRPHGDGDDNKRLMLRRSVSSRSGWDRVAGRSFFDELEVP